MAKKVQRVALSITDPSNKVVNLNEFNEDFADGAKKLIGINIKSGISGDSLITCHVKGERIVEDVPVSVFQCDEDYVAPDNRFFTFIPDTGDISTKSINIKVDDDGTASSYPYNATVLLLLEV